MHLKLASIVVVKILNPAFSLLILIVTGLMSASKIFGTTLTVNVMMKQGGS
jgi:hypothetical protein